MDSVLFRLLGPAGARGSLTAGQSFPWLVRKEFLWVSTEELCDWCDNSPPVPGSSPCDGQPHYPSQPANQAQLSKWQWDGNGSRHSGRKQGVKCLAPFALAQKSGQLSPNTLGPSSTHTFWAAPFPTSKMLHTDLEGKLQGSCGPTDSVVVRTHLESPMQIRRNCSETRAPNRPGPIPVLKE